MCDNSFSHMSIAVILIRGHSYSLPIGNDNNQNYCQNTNIVSFVCKLRCYSERLLEMQVVYVHVSDKCLYM